jgi:hypothetical protein
MQIPNGKSFSYQGQYSVDQARSGCEMHAVIMLPATRHFLWNPQCSPDHAMVYNENGTYTAVRRRAPHPTLCPSQIGEFFLPHPVKFMASVSSDEATRLV